MFIKALRGLSRERALHHVPNHAGRASAPFDENAKSSLIRCSTESSTYFFASANSPFARSSVFPQLLPSTQTFSAPLQHKIVFQLFINMINAITVSRSVTSAGGLCWSLLKYQQGVDSERCLQTDAPNQTANCCCR